MIQNITFTVSNMYYSILFAAYKYNFCVIM